MSVVDSNEGSCDESSDEIQSKLPEKNCLIKGKLSDYAVARTISLGRFGGVFELEVCDAHFHGLNMDYTVLEQATSSNRIHFATLIDRGKIQGHFKFVVMTMLGDNLQKLRHSFVECHFSLSTGLRLAIQTLAALEELHSMGFVHRDVKASNFTLSAGRNLPDSSSIVCIIDFGLCRMHRNSRNEVRTPRSKAPFRCSGTTRYASLSAHNEKELSPKDDLESWFYMVIEMISGSLPWSELHRTDRDEVKVRKENCRKHENAQNLFQDCPKVEFRRILNYIDSLVYQSQPDHKFLTQLLQLAMKNYSVKADEPFDWE